MSNQEIANEVIKIGIPAVAIFVGWIIVHFLTMKRDLRNKRHEIVLQHLVHAYRVLAHEISQRPETPERNEKLEQVISDIKLFGSHRQVLMARQLASDIAERKKFQLDPLINDLRNDLRKQLQLEELNGM